VGFVGVLVKVFVGPDEQTLMAALPMMVLPPHK
jgi:hypothetical protein